MDGRFFPHAELKRAWERSSNGSSIVHITAVPDREKAAKYLAKYAVKPIDVSRLKASSVCELASSLHRRRLLIPFGERAVSPAADDGEGGGGAATSAHLPIATVIRAYRRNEPIAVRLFAIAVLIAPAIARLIDPRKTRSIRATFRDGDVAAPTLCVGGDDAMISLATLVQEWADRHASQRPPPHPDDPLPSTRRPAPSATLPYSHDPRSLIV